MFLVVQHVLNSKEIFLDEKKMHSYKCANNHVGSGCQKTKRCTNVLIYLDKYLHHMHLKEKEKNWQNCLLYGCCQHLKCLLILKLR